VSPEGQPPRASEHEREATWPSRLGDGASQDDQLRDFLSAAEGWLWETDAQHRFVFFADVSCENQGFVLSPRRTDPHYGRTRIEFAMRHPGDEAMWDAHEADLAARRPFRELTYRSRHSRELLWIRTSGVPVFDVAGTFVGYRGLARNVSVEVEATSARAEQDRLMRSVVDGLSIGLCLFEPRGRLLLSNRAYAELSGLPYGTFREGMQRSDMIRVLALNGVFGPGDVELQVREQLALDASRPARRIRRSPDGRTVEVRFQPLSDQRQLLILSDVTALVTAEEEARQRAERLDHVLETLRSGVALFGHDDRVQFSNRRYAELLGMAPGSVASGVSLEAILRMQLERGEFLTLDGEAYVAQRLGLDSGRAHTVRRLRPNGRVIEIASDPLPDGGWIAVASDVTALAMAEDESRRRAEALAAVLEHVPHGICVFGADRLVRIVNNAYRSITSGVPIGIGDHLDDLIRAGALVGEYGTGDVEAIIATERSQDFRRPQSRRRRRPNGTAIDIRSAPMPDGGHVTVVTDITATVEAEAASSRRAALLDAMMASIRHGICLFDRSARLVSCNPIALELLRLEASDITVGMGVDAFLRRALGRGLFGLGPTGLARMQELLEQDRKTSWRQMLRLEDGRVLDIRSDPTGDQGFVLTYTDVTEQAEAEASLSRAKEAAEAASRAKSQFLASMSHELRTPLNAVIGFSETMRNEATNRPELANFHEFAGAIHDAGRHLLAVINDILDGARIESGRLEMTEDRVDLAALAASAQRLVEPVARSARVRLRAQLEPDLPALVADERRLRQVLLNLLSNAVKFTPGGGEVELAIRRGADGGIEMQVSDSGIGIHPGDLDRVFQPFTQLDNGLSRRFQGSGLGLFLSRALATAHGGSLHLESSPGSGTTAILALPASRTLPRDH